MRVGQRPIGVLAGAALALLAGCSGSAAEPTGLATSTVTSPTPGASGSPTDGAEAAVLDAWGRWWTAVVAAERGNPDPALFDGVGTGAARETELAIARNYEESGIVRAGEPTFTDVVVEVEGEGAMAAACMDRTAWRPEEVPEPTNGILPIQLRLELTDGAWLVADYVDVTLEVPC